MPDFKNLVNDKNVLYVVFILAILNILGYLLVQNLEAVAFFLIVGFLTTYFSKNMIIVLMISIVSTSLFTSTRPRVKEGMTSKKNSSKSDKKDDKKDDEKKNDSDADDADADADADADTDADDDVKPSEISTSVSSGKKKHFVSSADNLQNAFAKLNETVGKEGIEGLTGQTSKLLKQQEALMNNIEGMKPFLETAESFMNKIDLSSLDNVGGMLSKITGGAAK
jgi:hypothetical protein